MMLRCRSSTILCKYLAPTCRNARPILNLKCQKRPCTTGIGGVSTATPVMTNNRVADEANSRSTTTAIRNPVKSFLRSFLGGRLLRQEANTDDVALQESIIRLYNQCANIDFIRFIKKFNMGDTLESWFLITGLHMWFMLLRVRQESDFDIASIEEFREMFADVLWQDVNRRLDLISRNDVHLTKKAMKEETKRYYAYLMTSMMELDEGIMSDDVVLAGAVWRLFYKTQQVDDMVALNDLVRYVRYHVHQLGKRTMQDIVKNGVADWNMPDD